MNTPELKIDASLVHRLVEAQFPAWRNLAIKPVAQGGWDHRTFHLGDAMLARLPSAQRYTAQVEKEQRWLPKLAPKLPLRIPVPLARGEPGDGYPWHWSVYEWIDGNTASLEKISDLTEFARALGEFLGALQRIDPSDGPEPGPHNFFRGGALVTYDDETRNAIEKLGKRIDPRASTIWDEALASSWREAPVWVHGDVSAGNLLIKDGRLTAVIDFGCLGIGDPACDLSIAWTFFANESREAFRLALGLDAATWLRGRGWAMWKALITWAECTDESSPKAKNAQAVIAEILADRS